MELLKWVHNKRSRDAKYKKEELSGFSSEEMKEVYEFHKSLPDYKATPLVNLKNLFIDNNKGLKKPQSLELDFCDVK